MRCDEGRERKASGVIKAANRLEISSRSKRPEAGKVVRISNYPQGSHKHMHAALLSHVHAQTHVP